MSITILIIIITGIFSVLAWKDTKLLNKYTLSPYQFYHKKEYLRLITSGFLHADWSHLIFNMMSLYFFGRYLEMYLAYIFQSSPSWLPAIVYMFFYVLSIIVSDIHSIVMYKNNTRYHSLGASGAVCAVVFACIWISPLEEIYFMFFPFGIPGFIYGMLYLVYCSYQAKTGGDNVNHYAHFFGAIFGIAFVVLIYPNSVGMFFDQIATWKLF